jgi:hypothetical protein
MTNSDSVTQEYTSKCKLMKLVNKMCLFNNINKTEHANKLHKIKLHSDVQSHLQRVQMRIFSEVFG